MPTLSTRIKCYSIKLHEIFFFPQADIREAWTIILTLPFFSSQLKAMLWTLLIYVCATQIADGCSPNWTRESMWSRYQTKISGAKQGGRGGRKIGIDKSGKKSFMLWTYFRPLKASCWHWKHFQIRYFVNFREDIFTNCDMYQYEQIRSASLTIFISKSKGPTTIFGENICLRQCQPWAFRKLRVQWVFSGRSCME